MKSRNIRTRNVGIAIAAVVAVVAGLVPAASAQSLIVTLAPPVDENLGYFSMGLASLPDFTGDGIADFAIGAPGEGDNGDVLFGPGNVYLYSGADRSLVRTITTPLVTSGSSGGFGINLAGMGDVDGDGFGDLLVGATYENSTLDPTLFGTGHAYIYSGATGQLLVQLNSPNETDGGVFGWSTASVRDLTGDGRPDVLVGAPHEGPNQTTGQYEGRAYVYNGATGSLVRSIVSPGNQYFGRFGTETTGVPDVDGDGLGDYAVSGEDETVNGISNAGRVYLYSGATGDLIRTHVAPETSHYGVFGYSTTGIADLNGDGRGELVIAGVKVPDGQPVNAGRVYVYSGGNGALLYDLLSPDQQPNTGFGNSVAPVPDIDGDGFEDLLIGTGESTGPFEKNQSPNYHGRSYVYSGRTGSLIYSIDPETPDFLGYFGFRAVGIPDINGDGRGDLLLGGDGLPFAFGNGAAAGRAFVFSSGGCDFALGDVNNDGAVSLLDVSAFVTAVNGGPFVCEADINADGAVTLLDVAPFVTILTGG